MSDVGVQLREAMEARDKSAAECPIDKPGSKLPEACPRCRARRNETCVVKALADCQLIQDVRRILDEAGL